MTEKKVSTYFWLTLFQWKCTESVKWIIFISNTPTKNKGHVFKIYFYSHHNNSM